MTTQDQIAAILRSCAANNEDDAVNVCIDYLTVRGFTIQCPRDSARGTFTPRELCTRYGIKAPTLGARLGHPHCPAFAARRGPTGRILSIDLNPTLEAWLARPVRDYSPAAATATEPEPALA